MDRPEPFLLNTTSWVPPGTERSKLHGAERCSKATRLPEAKARTPPSQLMVEGGRATAALEVPLVRASIARAETAEDAALNCTPVTKPEKDT